MSNVALCSQPTECNNPHMPFRKLPGTYRPLPLLSIFVVACLPACNSPLREGTTHSFMMQSTRPAFLDPEVPGTPIASTSPSFFQDYPFL